MFPQSIPPPKKMKLTDNDWQSARPTSVFSFSVALEKRIHCSARKSSFSYDSNVTADLAPPERLVAADSNVKSKSSLLGLNILDGIFAFFIPLKMYIFQFESADCVL